MKTASLSRLMFATLLVIITAIAAGAAPNAAQAAVAPQWTCEYGNLLITAGPIDLDGVTNSYRINGTGPGLPTAPQLAYPGITYLTFELPGPGTWSNLTLEWSRDSLPYDQSMFSFTVDGCSETAPEPEPVPGCDVLVAIPPSAVGANFVADARVYWKPGEITEHVLPEGTHVRAIGKDATGEYYQVLYVCDFLWVKAETLGPNYESPWNGAPLPTVVVE